jgi:3'-5' exoribonuclease
MPEKVYVDELEEGQHVQTTFLVSRKQLDTTRHGDPYLRMTLRDKTGDIEARVWDDAERLAERFDVDDFVVVRASVSSYKGELQLKVDDAQPISPDETDPADFMPRSQWEPDDLMAQLTALLDDHVDAAPIRRLLDAVLGDDARATAFKRAPAATSNHHNYVGGLLEHTLSMARLAVRICDHYAQYYPGFVDVDLVLAGCVLHDIGKIDELGYERSFNYTTHGQLVGHVSSGDTLVKQVADEMDPSIEQTLVDHLRHLVLSHHGQREFGAPVTPRTPEALVLHQIDMLDSKVNMWHGHIEDHRNGPDGEEEWTDYNRSIESSVYAGPGEPPEWATEVAEEARDLDGPGLASTDDASELPDEPAASSDTDSRPNDDDDADDVRDDQTLSMFDD